MTLPIASMLSIALALALFPAAAPAQVAASETLSPTVNRDVAERAAHMLERQYVFPDAGRRYAAALRGHAAAGRYAAIDDPAILADRLTSDLQAVAPDGHLRFYHTAPALPEPVRDRAAGEPRSSLPGIRSMGWAAPGIAMIAFEHFDDGPQAKAAVTRFFDDYASATAFVIDVRSCGGGAFDLMGQIVNRLFATPRHLADMDMARQVFEQHGAPFPVDQVSLRAVAAPPARVRFAHWSAPIDPSSRWTRIPVYYLTSTRTFSAAEHLAMVLKDSGRARIIGQRTGGGNHFGGTEPVGGGLEMYVPIGRTTSAVNGEDWERIGIQPDIETAEDGALGVALRLASEKSR